MMSDERDEDDTGDEQGGGAGCPGQLPHDEVCSGQVLGPELQHLYTGEQDHTISDLSIMQSVLRFFIVSYNRVFS